MADHRPFWIPVSTSASQRGFGVWIGRLLPILISGMCWQLQIVYLLLFPENAQSSALQTSFFAALKTTENPVDFYVVVGFGGPQSSVGLGTLGLSGFQGMGG